MEPLTNGKDGGAAFPVPYQQCEYGMSLLDYFAAHALAGILSNPEVLRAQPPIMHAERAEAAYGAARAMLAERSKVPQ